MTGTNLDSDLVKALNMLGGSPGFVMQVDPGTGESTVANPAIVPKNGGEYWLGGETVLKSGHRLTSVFQVNTDTQGTLLGVWWRIGDTWFDHQDPAAIAELGIERAAAFPFDWTYAVPLSEDLYHDPPAAPAKGATFWDRAAPKYVAQPIADQDSYEKKIAQVRARLEPGWRVLELGCGSGNTALALAPDVAHVHATDISAAMLAHGRARAVREGVANVSFEQVSVEAIGTDAPYDAVLMNSLLHLLPDWQAGLDKARALTRPGGVFVSSTACLAAFPWPMKWAIRGMQLFGRAPTLSYFTAEALIAAIEARGFDIEECWQPRRRAALFIIARVPASSQPPSA